LATNNNDELVFLPLGGVGEIGMNLGLYGFGPEFDRTWIAVDFGISFAKENFPGIDIVYPDISYLEEERANLAGIVLTHAHEDHFGALLDLWPRLRVPVYATQFTAHLLAAKAAGEPNKEPVSVTTVRQGERFQVGPFEIEMINVAHSIPESNALAIRTPLGTVLHSGDYKLDKNPALGAPTDEKRLREIGDEGVLALISDSTNAMRDGSSPSETEIGRELAAIIREAKGRVAFTTFASNAGRLRSIALGAKQAGRQLVVAGRALHRILGVARELGMLDDIPPVLDQDAFASIPRDKVVLLLTGSQGEPRAALARVAQGDHPRVDLVAGDTLVFSARSIPGNESGIIAIMNDMTRRGVHLITDQDRPVHVSGHPRRDEMRTVYGWLRPTIAIPVHGEAMHLSAHAKLARELGVKTVLQIENGSIVRLAPGRAEITDSIESGRFYKDGNIIAEAGHLGVAVRRKLSFAGHVAIALAVDDRGQLRSEPVAALNGLPDESVDGTAMEDLVMDAVMGAFDSIPPRRRTDHGRVSEAIRRAVRAAVVRGWGKKPICSVLVTVV
jgi:ribonuclease J